MSDDADQVLAQYFALDEDGKATVLAKIQAGLDFSDLVAGGGGADLSDYSGSQVHLTATDSAEGAGIKLDVNGLGTIVIDSDVGVDINTSGVVSIVANQDVNIANPGGSVGLDATSGLLIATTVADGNVVLQAAGDNGQVNLIAISAVNAQAPDVGIIGDDTVLIQAPAIGFFDASAVAQPSTIPAAAGGVVIDAEARAALNALLTAVKALGLVAT